MSALTSNSTKTSGKIPTGLERIAPPWPVAIVFLLVGLLAVAVGLHDLFADPIQYQVNALFLLITGVIPVLALFAKLLGWGLASAESQRGTPLTPSLSSGGDASKAFTAVLYLLTPMAIAGISVSMLTAALLAADLSALTQLKRIVPWSMLTGPLLAATLQDPSGLMRIIPWLLIMVVTIWTVIRLWRRRSALTLRRNLRDIGSRWAKLSVWGVVGASLGAVSGLLPLWYGNEVRPLTAEPSVSIQSNLHRVSRMADGVTIVSGDITVHNQGEGAVTILGSLYELEAMSTKATDSPPTYNEYTAALNNNNAPFRRPHIIDRIQMVGVGWVTPRGWDLLRGEEYKRTFLAYLPAESESVWMRVELEEAKRSVLNITKVEQANPYPNGVEIKEDIEQVSWADRITKPSLSVLAWWSFRGAETYTTGTDTANPTDVTLGTCLYVSSKCATERPGFNPRYYGVLHNSRVNELSLIKPDTGGSTTTDGTGP